MAVTCTPRGAFSEKWPQFTTVTVCGVLARRMAQPMRLVSALPLLIFDKLCVGECVLGWMITAYGKKKEIAKDQV